MATTTSNFLAASQEWVIDRINGTKEFVEGKVRSLVDLITELSEREAEDVNKLSEQLGKLSDEISTGKLTVDGDVKITNTLDVSAGLSANGISTAGPLACTDPAGLVLKAPGVPPTGLTASTLTLANERGKLARIYMVGDQLVYDYKYDKIYTYFNPETGGILHYLHRGPTPLRQIVESVQQYPADSEREQALRHYFSVPGMEGEHAPAKLFGVTCHELFPALGTPYMIPESLFFEVPQAYRIDNIQLVNSQGHKVKILKDFKGHDVKQLLINFPYVRKVTEDPVTSEVIEPPPFTESEPTLHGETTTGIAARIPHVEGYDRSYYELTDGDAWFHEGLENGLIPNVILRLSEFPRDLPSVIFFDVKLA